MLPCLSKVNKTECTFLKDKNLFNMVSDAFPKEVNSYFV